MRTKGGGKEPNNLFLLLIHTNSRLLNLCYNYGEYMRYIIINNAIIILSKTKKYKYIKRYY